MTKLDPDELVAGLPLAEQCRLVDVDPLAANAAEQVYCRRKRFIPADLSPEDYCRRIRTLADDLGV